MRHLIRTLVLTAALAAAASATTQAAAAPDLIVTSISYASATGIFTSTVKNQGTTATPTGLDIGVAYFVDGVYRTWGGSFTSLAAGASVTIGSDGGAYAVSPGTHTVMAHVDDAQRIAESNENNNQLSKSITVSAADTTLPSAPTSLTATAVSPSQINLAWNASTDNVGVTGYRVYRGGALLATLGNVTSYQNTGLTAGTTFSYTVQAFDAAGNQSAQSAAASATTQAAAAPDLIVTSISYASATGIFTSTVKNQGTTATPTGLDIGVAYFVDGVYRTWGGSFTSLAAGASVTIGSDGGAYAVPPGTHTVLAHVDDAQRIAESNENNNQLSKSITVSVADTTLPSAPTSLTATAVSPSQINLAWNASTDNVGVTGYRVYRGGALLATLGNVTSYQNTGLTAGTTFSYTVQAFDAAGNQSAQSAAASATTQAAAAPDLIVTSISYASATGIFTSTVKNQGTTATPTGLDIGVAYFVDGVYRTWGGSFTSLAAGASVTIGSDGGAYAVAPGTHTVMAHVDDAQRIAESNENNNQLSKSITVSAADTTPPSVPMDLVASANSPVSLSWTASTDNVGVTGYRVYRNGTLVASPTGTSASITGLSAGATYTFTVSAVDAAGNASAQSAPVSVTIPATPAPTVSLSASPPTIGAGQSSTLTWSSTNATSCTASDGWSGTKASSGSQAVTPSATTVYILSCSGAGGFASASAMVTTATSTVPTVSLSASPAAITAGQSSTLTWSSTDANSCTASGGWSGTKANSGSQALTPSATTTYNLSCTGTGGSASDSETVTVSSTGAITPSLAASRVSGVAPLAVLFDATGTTAAATTRPFHDLEYQWDFGDAGSGVWTSTPNMPNLSRNQATGPVAAHVFESPGTYTVSLSAFDGVNTVTTSVQITVQDPDVVFAGSNTRCFSTTGNFAGCPAGAQQVSTSSLATVLANQAANRRLLLRRGETWTGGGAMTANGPWTIGAFGNAQDARPRVTGGGNLLTLSSPTTPNIKDGRVMDIQFTGTGSSAVGIQAGGAFQRVTFLRVGITNVNFALAINDAVLDFLNGTANNGHQLFDEIAVVDSAVTTIVNSGYGWFGAAHRIALLGNTFSDNPSGQHMIRITHTKKSVISHNSLTGAGPAKGVLKIHAMNWTTAGLANPGGAGTFTEQVVVSDNKLIGGGNSGGVDWPFLMMPTDTGKDERIRDGLIERNWFTASPGGGQRVALVLKAQHITVRNNIFDLSNGLDHSGVYVLNSGIAPAPTNVHVYNNTFYSSAASSNFIGVAIDGGSANTVVKNNLAYAPNDPLALMIDGTGTGLLQSNNSSNAQVRSVWPGFASASPSVPADFRLNPGSYAIDSGVPVPLFADFFRLSRPQNSVIDRGAAERP